MPTNEPEITIEYRAYITIGGVLTSNYYIVAKDAATEEPLISYADNDPSRVTFTTTATVTDIVEELDDENSSRVIGVKTETKEITTHISTVVFIKTITKIEQPPEI